MDWMETRYQVRQWFRRLWFGEMYYYACNRFIHKTHIVRLKQIEKGKSYDTDTMLFESVFQLLVNYVEEELSWMNKISYRKDKIDEYTDLDDEVRAWLNASWWDKWKNRKQWNVRLGMAYLEWAIGLGEESPHQSEYAKKTKELYLWYTVERKNRVEPWSLSGEPEHKYYHENGGYTDFMIEDSPCEVDVNGKPLLYRGRVMTEEYREWLGKCRDEETRQYDEDTEKAKQVLEIRQGLWT